MGNMLSNDETVIIAAILKTAGIEEIFITRETLANAFGGHLFVSEDFQRDGYTIRLENN